MSTISLRDAINRYRLDRSTSLKLEDKILDSCLYLDAVVTKLKQNKTAAQYLERAELDVKLMIEENKQYQVLPKFFVSFIDAEGFKNKYTYVYANSKEEAVEIVDERYPEIWDEVLPADQIPRAKLKTMQEVVS